LCVASATSQATPAAMPLRQILSRNATDDFDSSIDPRSGADISSDKATMITAASPDDDMHSESGQMMSAFSENSIDVGGAGTAMQLSGPVLPMVTTEDRRGDLDDIDPQTMGEEATLGAVTASKILESKQTTLSDARQMLQAEATPVKQEVSAANDVMHEAREKEAYLRDLQDKMQQQQAALDAQRYALSVQQQEISGLKAELSAKAAGVAQNSVATSTKTIVSAAILSQMDSLEKKKADFEAEVSDRTKGLAELEERLKQLQATVEHKDLALAKKEQDMKKLYVELARVSKSTTAREDEMRRHDAELRRVKDELIAKQSHMEAELRELESKVAAHRRGGAVSVKGTSEEHSSTEIAHKL